MVHDLGEGYQVQLPVASQPRWLNRLRSSDLQLLDYGKGEVAAKLVGSALHIEQTTVRYHRQGIATRMMERVFAVAAQHGAQTSGGVAFNGKILGMYAKMVGPENVEVIETNAPGDELSEIISNMPVQHVNDDWFCSYQIALDKLRPEHVVTVPDTTVDPV